MSHSQLVTTHTSREMKSSQYKTKAMMCPGQTEVDIDGMQSGGKISPPKVDAEAKETEDRNTLMHIALILRPRNNRDKSGRKSIPQRRNFLSLHYYKSYRRTKQKARLGREASLRHPYCSHDVSQSCFSDGQLWA